MARPIHFKIMAEDPSRAVEFYRQVFGWQVKKWDGPQEYWLVTIGAEETPGINGAIVRSSGHAQTVNTIEVDSVDEAAAIVTRHGGKVMSPKMTIPGVGYQVYCQDPEGIVFGLHQPDPTAK